MTNYSPLQDAKDETGNPITVESMNDAGYTDYDATGDPIDVQNHIVSALHALDGQIFDDPSKWAAVNELVAALDSIDDLFEMETTLQVEQHGSSIELQPQSDN